MINFSPPVGLDAVKERYGSYAYHDLSGGNVQIVGGWENDNIVTYRNVCGTGLNVRLHHLLGAHFLESFEAALKAAPLYKIRMIGGFCARHKMHDPSRGLSNHSWGAAFDVNWDTNPVHTPVITDLPPPFIEALTSRGWFWGGHWKRDVDAMHFEYSVGV